MHGSSLVAAARRGRPRMYPAGAVTLPRRESLLVAIVEAENQHRRRTAPWNDLGDGWDMAPARRMALNASSPLEAGARLLVDPQQWTSVDYSGAALLTLSGKAEWTVTRAGLAHGIGVWSEVVFADGIVAGGPCGTETAPDCVFFPWLEPVPMEPGDRVSLALEAAGVGCANIWTWTTSINGSARFRQSTFGAATWRA